MSSRSPASSEKRKDRRRSRSRSDSSDSDAEKYNRLEGERDKEKKYDIKKERRREKEKRLKEDSESENPIVQPPPVKPQAETPSGSVYIPPFRLAQMRQNLNDKSTKEYQRMHWDALKKSINGLCNKVTAANIKNIVAELFHENLIRGRGLFIRSIMKAQSASLRHTNVFASLVAVINTKVPEIGELLIKRLIMQFRRAYKRNDENTCVTTVHFIAHLVNQQVSHEILALEILSLLLESPTSDSVKIAINLFRLVGLLLKEAVPKAFYAIQERLLHIITEGNINLSTEYAIEEMHKVLRTNFQEYPTVEEELDLVEADDQITHTLSVNDTHDIERGLDLFHYDEQFEANEAEYSALKKEILGDSGSSEEGSSYDSGSGSGESDSASEENTAGQVQDTESQKIIDKTETNLVNLRRTIYLTVMSALNFEECVHKLLQMKLKDGQEIEVCRMIIECCAQEKSYVRFYGLMGQRFCNINMVYREHFSTLFAEHYSVIHRLETNRLRNVAKFFSHLFHTDAIDWTVLACIHLNESETTSSSRIFIKILFQDISEHLGLAQLNTRLKEPTLQPALEGLFPRDNPKNTRFSINFFIAIGLGKITEDLREYLKNAPQILAQKLAAEQALQLKAESSSSYDSYSYDSYSYDSDSSDDAAQKKKKTKGKVSKKEEKKKQKGKEKEKEKKKVSEPKPKVEKKVDAVEPERVNQKEKERESTEKKSEAKASKGSGRASSEVSRNPRDDSRSHREDSRSHREVSRNQKDDSRSHREDSRNQKGDSRSHREESRSHREDSRSHKDDSRSHRKDSRSHEEDPMSHKDDSRNYREDSRSRRDDSRSSRARRDNSRTHGDDSRSHRDDSRSRQSERRH
eukprot:GCRY01001017.1.p1 GENE.GCRY01001017.1~~GCRY01001017.1.p1  ORF type:complete len:862 (-),score=252.85 GCRY01001017.1:67-2652(-)